MSKQSEIAKQFDLPERQSKLNTMLREEGLRDEQVYCVCRSADVSRFMMGCDYCEEWYHGDCINVTEQEANGIRKFYCKKCRAKNPALQIKYKEKRSHHHHKHRHDKDKHRDKKSSSSKSEKLEKCGECEACYIREDCGRCEYCKDMTKFGGTGKLRQKCKKRQCQNFFHMAKKHHHKSGSKSSSSSDKQSSADYSRNDHSYNTQSKSSSSPLSSSSSKPVVSSSSSAVNKTSSGSLIIKSLSQYSTTSSTTTVVSTSTVVSTAISTKESTPVISSSPITSTAAAPKTSETSKGSSIASPLTNLTNSSQNRSTTATVSTSTPISTSGPSIPSTMFNKHDAPLYNDRDFIDDKDLWEPIKKKSKETVSRKRKDLIASRKRKSQESCSEPEDSWSVLDAQGPRQCMGPQCIKTAKSGSKYCSDECGLKLAEARIYSVLPPRIQEWKMSSCLAEERDRKQLEKIRSQQLEARKELQVLDDKHKEFDSQLEKWKSVSIDPQADEDGDEEGSEGALIYCVTCGHEVPTRRAVKHMHNCYNKLESQMSFGSMFKTRIEGNNMFCDAFNTTNRTYCKRLRVMCPEHTKESKTSNTEVCGFPLTTDVFTETGKVCRMSKKKCVRHYCWEKLRRANIDMERVRQCLKLDELVEQERQVRLAMTNRAGVLGLMLHSTYDHEYASKMQKQQQHQQHQQQHQHQHQHHKKQQQRQTDHLYHQDKPPPPSEFHPGSTNYHHHQIATDHHYHRQQQPDGLPDPGTKPNKKYQTGSKFSPSPSLGASAMPPSLNPPFFNLKLSQAVKAPSESHSGKFGGGSGPGKKQHYQSDQFYHNDSPPFNHDHQYFSNQPSAVDDKRNDHMYYSSKKK